MAMHYAEVEWTHKPHPQHPETFDRDHAVIFENGQSVTGSSAPAYFGNAETVNPETLLLAALASCHMLTFLAIATKLGYQVQTYRDKAAGTLGKNADGRMAIIHCALKPDIAFSGEKQPTPDELRKLHASAHRNCFIANTISCPVEVLE